MTQWDDAPTPTEECPPPQGSMEENLPEQQSKKQVRFKVKEEFGDDPTLPLDLITFLVGVMAEYKKMLPTPLLPCSWNPHSCLPAKAPGAIPLAQEGPSLRSKPNPLQFNTSHNPRGCWTWWTTPTDGSWQRWIGPECTLTGGSKSGPLKSSPWGAAPEDTPCGKTSVHPRPCTLLNGRLKPSGCKLPNRRPQVVGRAHPGSMGCVPRISWPTPMPLALGISGQWEEKTLGLAYALQACA